MKLINRYTLSIVAIFSLSFSALAQQEAEIEEVYSGGQLISTTTTTDGDTISIDTSIDVDDLLFPSYFYTTPTVFDEYELIEQEAPFSRKFSDNPTVARFQRRAYAYTSMRRFIQNQVANNPWNVDYALESLPLPPERVISSADPTGVKLDVGSINVSANEAESSVGIDLARKHWITAFKGLAQFSQAYNSPNWYQGGNNNLNMIVNGVYDIKLNPKFHPNLLFENTIQYKLALNSAPDDSIRSYAISEDLFQINSKFGIKAIQRWYYTLNLQFKTQFFQNFKSNTNDLKAAFLSPAELNIGLGMTYSYASPNNKFNIDLNIAPLSYNLKTCITSKMDETAFGIKPGRHSVSQYGSSVEAKMLWKIAYNITYSSRLFAFTDYSYLQGDWEHTMSFAINRYFSTQLYVHLRYDTSTDRLPDSSWHRWQVREILSFGFSYTLGNI